jgi:hypothetical protein
MRIILHDERPVANLARPKAAGPFTTQPGRLVDAKMPNSADDQCHLLLKVTLTASNSKLTAKNCFS